jgi:DNA-binding transcriptional ArsR family regulator
MNKTETFSEQLQQLSRFAKAISHPARVSILQYLAAAKTCISGDISDQIPLSRSTVSQHLKELRDAGLIIGEIDGLKINYCLCTSVVSRYRTLFEEFFKRLETEEIQCDCNS